MHPINHHHGAGGGAVTGARMQSSQQIAAEARIQELRASISKCDSDLSLLSRRILAVTDDAMQSLADKEAELQDRQATELARFDEQLAADSMLLEHFQDSATTQTIQALIDKQDAGLREMEGALRGALMAQADEEYQRREAEMVAEMAGVRARLLQQDADRYSACVQAAYIKHKEHMGGLDGP